jgi:hypothetical protein
MSKPRRVLFILATVGLLCVAYLWFFGVATMFVLEARYVGWKTPVVKRTPVELSDQSISQAPGRRLTYFGYEFEVPWDIDEAKSKQVGQMQLVAFRRGISLVISRSASKEFVTTFLQTNPAGMRALYGENVFQSDYSLKEMILEVTPNKVGLLTPRKEAVGSAMLLVIKGIMMPRGGESGIYRVRTGDFRGFQFGDPRNRLRSLTVEIYDGDGGLGFIFAQRENGSEPPITQAEINRVIRSVRKSTNPN